MGNIRNTIIFFFFALLIPPITLLANYNPQTGRFLQRDPIGVRDEICIIDFDNAGSPRFARSFESFDQYIQSMSLYEYVKSKPIDRNDPMGLYWMPGPGITAPPEKKPKCGICGPDVTAALIALREKMIEEFNKFSLEKQISKCTGLWGGATWDITELFYGTSEITPEGCSTGDCQGTVMVNGSCYSAHAVNYYMYGTMHSLCSALPEKTTRIGMIWPLVISGDVSCKYKWAWAGEWGDTSGVNCPEYDTCKICTNNSVKEMKYKWLSIREMLEEWFKEWW